MEIVLAEARHIDAITELERDIFSLPWSKKSFMSELEDKNSIFLAAEDGGVTVGFAIMKTYKNEGEIYNIAVSGDHRRRGVGDALMARLLSEAAKRGVDTVFLDVRESNSPARALYKKYGFYDLNIRRGYYDAPKEDAVIMIRMRAEENENADFSD